MIDVYSSLSSADMNVRRAMLEEAGIPTFVRNEALSLLTNPLIQPFQPALCVVNDEDAAQALALIRHLKDAPQGLDWSCPKCQESVPAAFDSCWNCESSRPLTDV